MRLFKSNVAVLSEPVVVTARRIEEAAQKVPIPVSVVDGTLAADAGAFNVNRLKELIPTVQFYSTNRATRQSASAVRARRSDSPMTASSRASVTETGQSRPPSG